MDWQDPNCTKYNIYVYQANTYLNTAEEIRRQADAMMSNMTFIVPTSVP